MESKKLLLSLPWMMKTFKERGVFALVGEFKSHYPTTTFSNVFIEEFKSYYHLSSTVRENVRILCTVLRKENKALPTQMTKT